MDKICWLIITGFMLAMFCGCIVLTMFGAMYLAMSWG